MWKKKKMKTECTFSDCQIHIGTKTRIYYNCLKKISIFVSFLNGSIFYLFFFFCWWVAMFSSFALFISFSSSSIYSHKICMFSTIIDLNRCCCCNVASTKFTNTEQCNATYAMLKSDRWGFINAIHKTRTIRISKINKHERNSL